jgi:hypothetical protein
VLNDKGFKPADHRATLLLLRRHDNRHLRSCTAVLKVEDVWILCCDLLVRRSTAPSVAMNDLRARPKPKIANADSQCFERFCALCAGQVPLAIGR